MLTVFIVCHLAVSDANARTRIVMAGHESSDPYVFLSLRWDFPYPQHTGSLIHTLSLNNVTAYVKVRAGRIPVIVVACGSYSPITIMHLRMLEDTRDAINSVSAPTQC